MKRVKSLLFLALAGTLTMSPAVAQQTSKELKKELKSKASKDIRKEAKEYEKAGYRSVAGSLPIAKQLEQAQMAAIEKDENGNNLYYIGRGKGIGGNYKAAKAVAYSQAKVDLAESVKTDIEGTTNTDMENEELGDGDVMTSDDLNKDNNLSSVFSINDIVPVVEIYRELGKGKYEVEMTVKMKASDARNRAKQAIHRQLKKGK